MLTEQLLKMNTQIMTRIYPKGSRVDSSNYDPQTSWNLGCSVVALNVQTRDFPMRLNDRKFDANGKCGYLLKPLWMRDLSLPKPKDQRTLHLRIISASQLRLSDGSVKNDKKTIDPYVECFVSGYGTDDTSGYVYQTNIIQDNAWHPIWTQDFMFHINCMELAMLTVRVIDYNSSSAHGFLGENTAALTHLKRGYRVVPLRDVEGSIIPNSTLLVRIRLTSTHVMSKELL